MKNGKVRDQTALRQNVFVFKLVLLFLSQLFMHMHVTPGNVPK